MPLSDDRIRIVGFPYLDRGRKRYENVTERDQIVFISQLTVGTELSKAAVAVSESAAIDADVVYKLSWGGRVNWQSAYPWLADSDVQVVDDLETPLYRLFAESTAQVGVYSTAVYEGIAFGLDTYLLDLPGIHHMNPLASSTSVPRCKSPSALVDAIAADAADPVDADQFFEPGAFENVERELERVRDDA